MAISLVLLTIVIVLLPWLISRYQKKYFKDAVNIPGPPGLLLVGNIFDLGFNTDTIFHTLIKLRKKYGSCFGLWMSSFSFRVVLSDAEYLEQILTSKEYDKGSSYDMLKPLIGNSVLVSKAEIWRKQRKLLTPTFHVKLIEQFYEVFNSATNTFIDILMKEGSHGPVDPYNYLKSFTMDVICETIMGVPINAQHNENREYTDAIDNYLKLFILKFFSIIRRVKPYYKLTKDYETEEKVSKIIKDMTKMVIERCKERRQDHNIDKTNLREDEFGIKRKVALMDLLLDLYYNKDFTEEDLNDEANTFIIAGHHTTACALNFILYNLSRYPEMQEKMVEEIYSVLGPNIDEPITMEHTKQLKYMDRFIKESFRMHPPVPVIERKLNDDFIIGDHTLPKDTNIIIYIYGLHHNEKYYPEPEKFDPDRFLPENIKHQAAYMPFSHGPRNCIGLQFALHEIKAFLANVLRKLEIKRVEGHEPKLSADATLKSLNGLPIRVQFRQQ